MEPLPPLPRPSFQPLPRGECLLAGVDAFEAPAVVLAHEVIHCRDEIKADKILAIDGEAKRVAAAGKV